MIETMIDLELYGVEVGIAGWFNHLDRAIAWSSGGTAGCDRAANGTKSAAYGEDGITVVIGNGIGDG